MLCLLCALLGAVRQGLRELTVYWPAYTAPGEPPHQHMVCPACRTEYCSISRCA